MKNLSSSLGMGARLVVRDHDISNRNVIAKADSKSDTSPGMPWHITHEAARSDVVTLCENDHRVLPAAHATLPPLMLPIGARVQRKHTSNDWQRLNPPNICL